MRSPSANVQEKECVDESNANLRSDYFSNGSVLSDDTIDVIVPPRCVAHQPQPQPQPPAPESEAIVSKQATTGTSTMAYDSLVNNSNIFGKELKVIIDNAKKQLEFDACEVRKSENVSDRGVAVVADNFEEGNTPEQREVTEAPVERNEEVRDREDAPTSSALSKYTYAEQTILSIFARGREEVSPSPHQTSTASAQRWDRVESQSNLEEKYSTMSEENMISYPPVMRIAESIKLVDSFRSLKSRREIGLDDNFEKIQTSMELPVPIQLQGDSGIFDLPTFPVTEECSDSTTTPAAISSKTKPITPAVTIVDYRTVEQVEVFGKIERYEMETVASPRIDRETMEFFFKDESARIGAGSISSLKSRKKLVGEKNSKSVGSNHTLHSSARSVPSPSYQVNTPNRESKNAVEPDAFDEIATNLSLSSLRSKAKHAPKNSDKSNKVSQSLSYVKNSLSFKDKRYEPPMRQARPEVNDIPSANLPEEKFSMLQPNSAIPLLMTPQLSQPIEREVNRVPFEIMTQPIRNPNTTQSAVLTNDQASFKSGLCSSKGSRGKGKFSDHVVKDDHLDGKMIKVNVAEIHDELERILTPSSRKIPVMEPESEPNPTAKSFISIFGFGTEDFQLDKSPNPEEKVVVSKPNKQNQLINADDDGIAIDELERVLTPSARKDPVAELEPSLTKPILSTVGLSCDLPLEQQLERVPTPSARKSPVAEVESGLTKPILPTLGLASDLPLERVLTPSARKSPVAELDPGLKKPVISIVGLTSDLPLEEILAQDATITTYTTGKQEQSNPTSKPSAPCNEEDPFFIYDVNSSEIIQIGGQSIEANLNTIMYNDIPETIDYGVHFGTTEAIRVDEVEAVRVDEEDDSTTKTEDRSKAKKNPFNPIAIGKFATKFVSGRKSHSPGRNVEPKRGYVSRLKDKARQDAVVEKLVRSLSKTDYLLNSKEDQSLDALSEPSDITLKKVAIPGACSVAIVGANQQHPKKDTETLSLPLSLPKKKPSIEKKTIAVLQEFAAFMTSSAMPGEICHSDEISDKVTVFDGGMDQIEVVEMGTEKEPKVLDHEGDVVVVEIAEKRKSPMNSSIVKFHASTTLPAVQPLEKEIPPSTIGIVSDPVHFDFSSKELLLPKATELGQQKTTFGLAVKRFFSRTKATLAQGGGNRAKLQVTEMRSIKKISEDKDAKMEISEFHTDDDKIECIASTSFDSCAAKSPRTMQILDEAEDNRVDVPSQIIGFIESNSQSLSVSRAETRDPNEPNRGLSNNLCILDSNMIRSDEPETNQLSPQHSVKSFRTNLCLAEAQTQKPIETEVATALQPKASKVKRDAKAQVKDRLVISPKSLSSSRMPNNLHMIIEEVQAANSEPKSPSHLLTKESDNVADRKVSDDDGEHSPSVKIAKDTLPAAKNKGDVKLITSIKQPNNQLPIKVGSQSDIADLCDKDSASAMIEPRASPTKMLDKKMPQLSNDNDAIVTPHKQMNDSSFPPKAKFNIKPASTIEPQSEELKQKVVDTTIVKTPKNCNTQSQPERGNYRALVDKRIEKAKVSLTQKTSTSTMVESSGLKTPREPPGKLKSVQEKSSKKSENESRIKTDKFQTSSSERKDNINNQNNQKGKSNLQKDRVKCKVESKKPLESESIGDDKKESKVDHNHEKPIKSPDKRKGTNKEESIDVSRYVSPSNRGHDVVTPTRKAQPIVNETEKVTNDLRHGNQKYHFSFEDEDSTIKIVGKIEENQDKSVTEHDAETESLFETSTMASKRRQESFFGLGGLTRRHSRERRMETGAIKKYTHANDVSILDRDLFRDVPIQQKMRVDATSDEDVDSAIEEGDNESEPVVTSSFVKELLTPRERLCVDEVARDAGLRTDEAGRLLSHTNHHSTKKRVDYFQDEETLNSYGVPRVISHVSHAVSDDVSEATAPSYLQVDARSPFQTDRDRAQPAFLKKPKISARKGRDNIRGTSAPTQFLIVDDAEQASRISRTSSTHFSKISKVSIRNGKTKALLRTRKSVHRDEELSQAASRMSKSLSTMKAAKTKVSAEEVSVSHSLKSIQHSYDDDNDNDPYNKITNENSNWGWNGSGWLW